MYDALLPQIEAQLKNAREQAHIWNADALRLEGQVHLLRQLSQLPAAPAPDTQPTESAGDVPVTE